MHDIRVDIDMMYMQYKDKSKDERTKIYREI